MRPPKTFRHGGLSLDLERDWRPVSPVQNSFLPNAAAILLKQHAGPAARCLVRKGEYVREGALLGKAEGPGSAAIHASVPGVVRDIRRVRLPEGGECEAAVIVLEGSFDRLGKRVEKYLWKGVSRGDLLQTLRDRGVVETEAPGRPLYELLREREKTDLLVLNAVESEPYLRTEAAVLADRGPEVLEGFAILRKILAPERWILALDASEKEAVARAAESAKSLEEAPDSILLEPRYPQDLPSLLLEVIQRDRHGAKGAPSAVIVRPSTALAVYEAVALAKPFLERYVTVAGGAVKNPAVLKVRIGTPIGDLIEECGGFSGTPERIVLGGPLRGLPVYDLDAPVTKQTSAVLALHAEETRKSRRRPCIRCGRCAESCPERLDPAGLYRRVVADRREDAAALGLADCSACGVCGFLCPSRLPLVETLAAARDAIKEGA